MNLLQNVIILTTGFLLSQVLIATNTHYRLIAFLLRHGGSGFRSLLTSVLLISYGLSIFLSNTVVVLAMLPVINRLMNFLSDRASKKEIATMFYLALTFGATTGGLASLSGNPLNAFAVGLLEFYRVDHREQVNFFSWLMVGLPVSLLIITCGRTILLHAARNCSETALVYATSSETALFPHRPLLFFAINMGFVTTLTGVQFFLKPEPSVANLSWIDLSFLCYGVFFILFSFLYPEKKGEPRSIRKNALFLIFFVAAFPVLLFSRIAMEMERHLRIPLTPFHVVPERALQKFFDAVWGRIFGEQPGSLETPNGNAVLSINRIILDIPYFGLLLIMIFGSLLYFAVKAGDNPATPESDGYIITSLGALVLGVLEPLKSPLLFLPVMNMAAVFSSELLSNTAIVAILAPLVITLAPHTSLSALLLLLSLTIGASAAYMTPLASPANTLAFGGLEHVSLKTVVKAGLIMNITSAALISLTFLGISFFL